MEEARSGIIVSQSLGIFTDAVKATHIIRKVLLRQIASLGAVLLVLAFAGASPSFAWSENNCRHTWPSASFPPGLGPFRVMLRRTDGQDHR
jgi:hypothetical protein